MLAEIRRTQGSRKEAKAALLVSDVQRCVAAMPLTLIGTRDRALLLMLLYGDRSWSPWISPIFKSRPVG